MHQSVSKTCKIFYFVLLYMFFLSYSTRVLYRFPINHFCFGRFIYRMCPFNSYRFFLDSFFSYAFCCVWDSVLHSIGHCPGIGRHSGSSLSWCRVPMRPPFWTTQQCTRRYWNGISMMSPFSGTKRCTPRAIYYGFSKKNNELYADAGAFWPFFFCLWWTKILLHLFFLSLLHIDCAFSFCHLIIYGIQRFRDR